MSQMPLNPFLRPLPSRRPISAPLPSANAAGSGAAVGGGAQVLSTRAQKLQAIVADVHARTARIERLRAVGHFAQEELRNTQHTGSSRLEWLAQQIKKKDI